LAIAELAGKRWAEYGRESALKLSGEKSEASKRALLLSDIDAIFAKAQASRMASAEICNKLQDIEEHPWPEWRNGKPITVRQLARLLEPLGIRPKQLRMGEVKVRGYEAAVRGRRTLSPPGQTLKEHGFTSRSLVGTKAMPSLHAVTEYSRAKHTVSEGIRLFRRVRVWHNALNG